MAISASTINQDRVYRKDSSKSMFEDGLNVNSATLTCNQCDLMCLDTGTHKIRPVAATSDAATFIGISTVALVNGVLVGPYTGLATPGSLSDFRGPEFGVVALMILKTGDAFNPGDELYLADGQNCQTLSVTNPGDGLFIGVYVGPAIASAAAGQTGQCKIFNRYATLQF